MNKLWVLLKANITANLGFNKVLHARDKKQKWKALGMTLLFLFLFVYLFVVLTVSSYAMAGELAKMGLLSLLLATAYLMGFMVSLFMTIYKASGFLFTSKDLDLLYSLPVKRSHVLISKMTFLYLQNLAYTIFATVPSLLVYGLHSGASPLFYIIMVILLLCLPLIPMVMGIFLSFLLGLVATKFRSSNLVMIIGSILFVVAVLAFSFSFSTVDPESVDLSAMVSVLQGISKILFLAPVFMNALMQDFPAFLVFLLVNLAVFLVFCALFGKGFQKINMKMGETYRSADYQMRSLKSSSVTAALIKKEARSFFSSYIYLINTGIGVVLMLVGSVALIFLGEKKLFMLLGMPNAGGMILPLVALVFGFCVIMTSTTAPSISLEGKNLWILKSLPVSPASVFKSKVLFNLMVVVPALLVSLAIVSVYFKFRPMEILLLLFALLMASCFTAQCGLFCNLLIPKLDWTSQIYAVKQSMSVFVNLMIGFFILFGSFYLFQLLQDTLLLLALAGTVLLILNIILLFLLKTVGTKKFLSL